MLCPEYHANTEVDAFIKSKKSKQRGHGRVARSPYMTTGPDLYVLLHLKIEAPCRHRERCSLAAPPNIWSLLPRKSLLSGGMITQGQMGKDGYSC